MPRKPGLIPLPADVFFVNLSIAIMAGLGFASVVTMIVVPTLYAIPFRVKAPIGEPESGPGETSASATESPA